MSKNGRSRLPDYEVRIDGSLMPQQARRDLRALMVQEDVAAAGTFTLTFYNWDQRRRKFLWSDDDLFLPGGEMDVRLGYQGAPLQTVMLGEITGLEPSFAAEGPAMLVVRGYDHRHRLMRGRKTRSFANMSDSDIARKISRDAGLGAQVTDSRVKLEYVLQHNQSDHEFLQARARRLGYEFFVRDKVLYFRRPDPGSERRISLALADDVVEFYPRLTTMGQVNEVQVQAWDVQKKQAISGQAGAGRETATMGGQTGARVTRSAFGSSVQGQVRQVAADGAEVGQMALGQFNERAMAYVTGFGVCYGHNELRAGLVAEIDGAGERFSGAYYVTAVTHKLTPAQGYLTTFEVARNGT